MKYGITDNIMSQPGKKPALTHEALTDIIDLALWAGQLLLQNGASSHRVEGTVHQIGTGLGCDWMDVLVSHNAIVVTTISAGDFRTKIRRVPKHGVDLTVVSAVNRLRYHLSDGTIDAAKLRTELQRISTRKPMYPFWLKALMVGLACGAFCRLFGGGYEAVVLTTVASTTGMFVRQLLLREEFNTYLIVIVTAFATSVIAALGKYIGIADYPVALAAGVLMLIPGVPLINMVLDFVRGYINVGISRGIFGLLITLSIAIGLLLAVRITGVPGL